MTTKSPNQMSLKELAGKINPNYFHGKLVCFDPGETTGLAIFDDLTLRNAEQLVTKDLRDGSRDINSVFDTYIREGDDVRVIIEDYRVYGWKTEQHAWAGLHTPKLIGAIIALCTIYDVPFHMQMAHQAKQFCTDEKLKTWGLYKSGLKHARDAIRHGCYYSLFHKEALN